MKALIVDDEPFARGRLRRLLTEQAVEIVGESASAMECLQSVETLSPDLLFVDIQMPGMTGMEMAKTLMHLDLPPLVVFVTGYSEHAVSAFEHTALDYLVKPVSSERLALTLVRARDRLADRAARAILGYMAHQSTSRPAPMDRLPVRGGFSVKMLPTREILCVVSRSRKVAVVTPEGEHPAGYSLRELESMLPGDRFLRIHDSCLVNLHAIRDLNFLGDHSYEVRLTNGLRLPVSRARYGELSRRLGLDPSPPSP